MSRYDAQADKITTPRDKWHETTYTNGARCVQIRCDRCSAAVTLSVHTVDSDGVVSPSVGCWSCGRHTWNTLEGFDIEPITAKAKT